MLDQIQWELSVLSRCVNYKNLSGASPQVGLSQPQLSRIIGKLERELGITLLDREAKRKSSWTPTAFELAQIYHDSIQSFERKLKLVIEDSVPKHVKIGCLEGFMDLGLQVAHTIIKNTEVKTLELNVYDLHVLEGQFLSAELDLVFSAREPGKRKYSHIRKLGVQSFTEIDTDPKLLVLSSFQYAKDHYKKAMNDHDHQYFVSNSLEVRRRWLNTYQGSGNLPAPVKKSLPAKQITNEVLMIALDDLHESIWKVCKGFQIA